MCDWLLLSLVTNSTHIHEILFAASVICKATINENDEVL